MFRRSVLLALTTGFTGCGPLTFSTEVTGEGVVPGDMTGGVLTTFPPLGNLSNIDFGQLQDFKTNKVTRDGVQSAHVRQLTLRVTSPSDQDFTFLDSVQLVVRSGQLETLIAQRDKIGSLTLKTPNPTLQLNLVDVDVAAHVRAPTASIVLRGKGHAPSVDTRLEATVRFEVSAKPE